ncbi:MAG: hypothetical protein GY940_24695, partial [bacterium]|nr:hypothetical protein [bacterium]
SAQPHVHIQVQATADTSHTVPFVFGSYAEDYCFKAQGLPLEGSRVEPLFWSTGIDAVTSAAVGDMHHYEVLEGGEVVDRLELVVRMAADGTFYFDSGRGRLYFGKHNGTMYFYSLEGRDPYLKAMLTALPRFPLACRQDLFWEEQLPVGSILKGFRKTAVQLLTSFYHQVAETRAIFSCSRNNVITGTIQARFPGVKLETAVKWDEKTGFNVFKVGSLELR